MDARIETGDTYFKFNNQKIEHVVFESALLATYAQEKVRVCKR